MDMQKLMNHMALYIQQSEIDTIQEHKYLNPQLKCPCPIDFDLDVCSSNDYDFKCNTCFHGRELIDKVFGYGEYSEVTEKIINSPEYSKDRCDICKETKTLKYREWYITEHSAVCDVCVKRIVRDAGFSV